jgi:hypothetical protein
LIWISFCHSDNKYIEIKSSKMAPEDFEMIAVVQGKLTQNKNTVEAA